MHWVKHLGQRLFAPGFDRQAAEILIRTASLSGVMALCIPGLTP